MRPLKSHEKAVLAFLRGNARASLTTISKALGLPLTTTFAVVKRITPLIKKYTTLLDFEQFPFGVQVFYFFRIKKEEKESFLSFLLCSPWLNTLAKTNDGLSFFCEMIFQSNKQRHIFEDQLYDFTLMKKEAHEIIEEFSREQFLSSATVLDDFFSS